MYGIIDDYWIIRKIMHTRGGIFVIIQQPVVNYSTYTTVATPQYIDQSIYISRYSSGLST